MKLDIEKLQLLILALYLLLCIVTIFAPTCQQDSRVINYNPLYPQISIVASTDIGRYLIQYGYFRSDGRLAFVAFTGWTKRGCETNSLVTISSHRSYVVKPNGTIEYLPSDTQLFEYIDGVYSESKEKVTKEAFETFLASNPKEYTIKSLLTFYKSQLSVEH